MGADDVDQRLGRASQHRRALEEDGIWFAPIRHHSPACARGVANLLEEIKPQAVLIEGPSEYDALLPALADPATKPPVAVLSVRQAGKDTASYFYPLASFSPEWVGLRAGIAQGAAVAFIDRGFTKVTDDSQLLGLATERYYAHSQALASLAQSQHCRDHDELWEHLFELRPRGWRQLFDEVFAWSALARFDYEPEVLAAEGSVAREAAMVAHIRYWRAQVEGPIVVITGAFHTLALVDSLVSGAPGVPEPVSTEPGWLIRYDLAQIDSLTGYGAGVRAPGFYQRQWDSPGTADVVTEIAHLTNKAGTSDLVSTAQVIEANLQAARLAQLRGHTIPGRTDVLDACSSCFAQGDPSPALRDAIDEVMRGSLVGEVPRNTPAPPIVAEALGRARSLKLVVGDSARRTVALDVHRTALARSRSRFFWLMSLLDVGFVRYLGGPDYIAGLGLSRLREQWEYAWTPMVEARLIGLINEGASLHEVARYRLRASDAPQRSSRLVAELASRAALVGLDDELARLRQELDQVIVQDPSLTSVLGAIRQVLSLWRSREVLEIAEPDLLLQLVQRAAPQVTYLLDQAAHVAADAEPEAIECLVRAQDLIRTMGRNDSGPAPLGMLVDGLARLRQTATAPGVLGAAIALGVTNGEVTVQELGARVEAAFAPGADAEHSLRFFGGVMKAAPDLFLHTPELFQAVDRLITTMAPDKFLELLPDLRLSFTGLRPAETARVAELVASQIGIAPAELDLAVQLDPRELALGAQVEAALLESLRRDGLVGAA